MITKTKSVKKRKQKLENTAVERPRIIAFEVTRKCRYSCKHCRAGAGISENEKELSTEQCEKILEAIAAYSRCTIILTGGEPMERDDIYDIIRYGRKLKLKMVLATCGYPINEESIIKLKKAGITALSFSIDGSSAETHDTFRGVQGAFDTAIKATQIARKAGIAFQINTTVTKFNIDEAIAIAELVERLGAYCFNPFILVPTGRGAGIADAIMDPIDYEIFLNELLRIKHKAKIQVRVTCGPQFAMICKQAQAKKLTESAGGCIGGRGFGFISYLGDVQTCGFLDISAGNLVKKRYNFAGIWEKSKLLKDIRHPAQYTGRCRNCEYVGVCGGCRARAYLGTGDYLEADPICNYKPAEKI